ncbi:hypothetical protein [Brasilonema sp. UFV-L1]|uniref:hypothetical protein n=1 Tax=Brasilonema sp. UFV-L1 TaxID=2234130 RepID=UPI00145E4179|nr:hypothetical protein [Brasilonema sp. UFV-L1]
MVQLKGIAIAHPKTFRVSPSCALGLGRTGARLSRNRNGGRSWGKPPRPQRLGKPSLRLATLTTKMDNPCIFAASRQLVLPKFWAS